VAEFKRYRVNTFNGLLGDFATEWWTDEDHANWALKVAQMKKDGTYMQPVTYTMDLAHNPLYDDTNLRQRIESSRFEIMDFSKLP